MNTQLTIEGMTCAACASRVGRALQAVPGVTHAHVNLATERAEITGDVTLATLLEAVEESGYGAHPFTPAEDRAAARAAEQQRLGHAAALALALALPLLLLEMSGHLLPAIHHWIAHAIGLPASHMIQGGLATLILFGPGLRFFRLGLPALWRRAPDMNALVAIGAGAAWVYSVAILATTPEEAVYFESAGVIVALVLLGRWLEGARAAAPRAPSAPFPAWRRAPPAGPMAARWRSMPWRWATPCSSAPARPFPPMAPC